MRAEYKTILVRFRKDDQEHMSAWEYIHDICSRKRAAADVLAELVREKDRSGITVPASEEQIKEMLSDVLHLCRDMDAKIGRGVLSPASENVSSDGLRQEKDQGEVEVETGIIDFALDMGALISGGYQSAHGLP